MLEHGEVQSMFKLRATSCLYSAIENCHDAVEITSLDPEKSELQVEVKNNGLILLFSIENTVDSLQGRHPWDKL